MLTLNDGRNELWQWDTGRTATVNNACDIVHFSCLSYGEALAVKVKNGVVEIPNKLLILGANINAWAFVTDGEGGYTKQEQTLKVNKRAKPSDYVYTETEVVTIETAVNNALEKAKESGEFDGKDGKDGVDGKDGANGNDGADGKDGLTPYIKNGNWWIGDTDTGTKAEGADGKDGANGKDGIDGKNGLDGKDGQNGADGYTPVRGKDYWTPEDEAKIKADVETMVGDIDSVLDAIIAKQTEVLGGDS